MPFRGRASLGGAWVSVFLALRLVACSSDSSSANLPREAGTDAPGPTTGSGGAPTTPHRDAGNGNGGATPRDASTSSGGSPEHDASVDARTDATIDAGIDGGARVPSYDWQVYYGQSYAAHVEVDSKGAAIVSGTLFDTKAVTLGAHTVTSHGMADVMLSRILPSGDVDWARGYGGTADDYPISFVLDPSDGIRLVGLYNGTGNLGGPDFPAFAGTPSRYDVYVAALDADGDHRWSHAVTSTEEAFAGPGLALDAAGNLLVPGSFLGTATIGGVAHASKGSWDGYLARFDEPNGALAQAPLQFGGTLDDRAGQVVLTGTGALLLGRFQGSVAFPTTPPTTLTSNGGTDVFLAEIAANGTMTSVRAFGGPGDEDVTRAALDPQGNIVLGGVFSSPSISVFGTTSLETTGGRDLYVAALSPSLSPLWAVRFGGDADDYLRDVAIDAAGTIAITGEFRDSMELGDRTYAAARKSDAGPSDIDFFIATLDARGVPTWSQAAGGDSADRGLGVAIDRTGNVYVTASFQSPIDFGGGVTLSPAPGQFGSALVRYAVH